MFILTRYTYRIVAIITMGIYIYVGIGIFRKRRQLREFSRTHSANNHPAQQSTMTTNEVRVTKEVVTSRHSRSLSRYAPAIDGHTIESDREPLELKRYSVTVDTGGNISQPQMTDIFPTHNHQPPTTTITPYQPQNDVAWTYTRAAVAYFIAMVVTWVSRDQFNNPEKTFSPLSKLTLIPLLKPPGPIKRLSTSRPNPSGIPAISFHLSCCLGLTSTRILEWTHLYVGFTEGRASLV